MDENKIDLNVKIKQEKVSPEREIKKEDGDKEDELDRILNSNIFGETDEKKNLEPAKTSDELLQELFGAIGYSSVNIPELFNESDKKKKKKKKRKHENDDDETSSKKSKKMKKEKKIKKESDRDKKDESKKIKQERKDKEEITERREVSIVIKDLKYKTEVKKPSSSSHSKHKDKKDDDKKKTKSKDRSKDKDKSKKEKKRSEEICSDISLSDEELSKHYEYHMSSRWVDARDRNNRDWDRDKRRRDYSRDRDRYSRYNNRRSRSRSRSRSRRGHTPIDKKRLLEIARKNAISMLKSGTLPRISTNAKEKMIAKIRHGGKTIEELTNYCKKLSRAEDLGELSDLSDSEIDGEGLPKAFHHPFEVKDRGPIVMNIKNAISIAPKPASELKAIMSQFPVSSGKQHQLVENTWVPVTTSSIPSTVTASSTTAVATITSTAKTVVTLQKQIQEQLPELLAKPKPPPPPPTPANTALSKPYDWKSDDHYCKNIVPTLTPVPDPQCDVSEIISQRLNAVRKLQENPHDIEASKVLHETQQNMSLWAASKVTPGQFLGSTEVRVLSQKELAAGNQAWAKRNQLIDTAPVTSGMGMHLLKKMGWCPGEGLGKEKNGALTPLLLELKLDKRGLEANAEVLRQKAAQGKTKRGGGRVGVPGGGQKQPPISMDSLQQKHPVSLLGELASKRRWGAPNYHLVSEHGPPHAKNFIFKVTLNGIEYTCPTPSNNKKEAKANVAKFCLQELGILPS